MWLRIDDQSGIVTTLCVPIHAVRLFTHFFLGLANQMTRLSLSDKMSDASSGATITYNAGSQIAKPG